ncbi:endonuclease/exonuclease/phosphatase family protein [Paenibacillus sp. chi10]|uniref:Endonuclease/exonuclease/phosphatase family protein n=1 Tax=Paenibacillus suaedae TaxID=3077233 RepID=A0AAJ2JRC1_9BACL|nr:endonuclease/exonuclease/phosphatase family protein [Paenibacillus sp. chi10]MDT8974747.1 endonuclease/exonuclease/phosphatase family protein [Paenibacillus sp. chi10]
MSTSQIALSVMSYNIRHGEGMDHMYAANRIVEVIRASGADIIGLQEVDRYYSARSNYEDTIAVLAEQILSHQHYPLSSDESEQRGLLAAVLDVDGINLHFYTTHLGLAQSERVEQVKEIINIVASHTMEPCIITGDFNAHPDSVEVASMSPAFCSAFADEHDAFTFPAGNAVETLDYIFVNHQSGNIEDRTVIHSSLASDHYPIAAKLLL